MSVKFALYCLLRHSLNFSVLLKIKINNLKMDEKVMIKLSKKIEYLVHKRHRTFRHIQNAMGKEGTFWLNCVKLNKQSISKIL
jgi:hypothetical protein